MRKVQQGDVFVVDLSDDSVHNEQSGIRPCVVMSLDLRNETSGNVFIFPITHAKKKFQPCHYTLYKKDYPFFVHEENIVLCEEGRSISKKRLERKLGTIDKHDIEKILEYKEYVFIRKEQI